MRVGAVLAAAAVVGTLGGHRAPGTPPHLCLCAAWLPQGTPPPESWDELVDGRALIGCPATLPVERLRLEGGAGGAGGAGGEGGEGGEGGAAEGEELVQDLMRVQGALRALLEMLAHASEQLQALTLTPTLSITLTPP